MSASATVRKVFVVGPDCSAFLNRFMENTRPPIVYLEKGFENQFPIYVCKGKLQLEYYQKPKLEEKDVLRADAIFITVDLNQQFFVDDLMESMMEIKRNVTFEAPLFIVTNQAPEVDAWKTRYMNMLAPLVGASLIVTDNQAPSEHLFEQNPELRELKNVLNSLPDVDTPTSTAVPSCPNAMNRVNSLLGQFLPNLIGQCSSS